MTTFSIVLQICFLLQSGLSCTSPHMSAESYDTLALCDAAGRVAGERVVAELPGAYLQRHGTTPPALGVRVGCVEQDST